MTMDREYINIHDLPDSCKNTHIQMYADDAVTCSNIYWGDFVTEFKYLGVILDSFLTFKKHIRKISKMNKFNLDNFRHIQSSWWGCVCQVLQWGWRTG